MHLCCDTDMTTLLGHVSGQPGARRHFLSAREADDRCLTDLRSWYSRLGRTSATLTFLQLQCHTGKTTSALSLLAIPRYKCGTLIMAILHIDPVKMLNFEPERGQ